MHLYCLSALHLPETGHHPETTGEEFTHPVSAADCIVLALLSPADSRGCPRHLTPNVAKRGESDSVSQKYVPGALLLNVQQMS